MAVRVTSQYLAEVVVDGTLKNFGPATVYYRDRSPVSASLRDGVLAVGESIDLDGVQALRASADYANVAIIPGGSPALGFNPVWKHFGEPGVGGRMTAFAISPHDPNRLLVSGDMLGIGLSEDRGVTWQATTGLPSWEMAAITFHPTDPKIVWVGSMSGPARSDDGGRTWTIKDNGLPAKSTANGYPFTRPVERVLVDPSNPSHLLAFGGNNRTWKNSVSDVVNYGKCYESLDGGETWTVKSEVGPDPQHNIAGVVHVGTNLDTLYALTTARGLFKSTDGGSTWTQTSNGLPGGALCRGRQLASDPASGTVWAALNPGPSSESGGIYRTDDAGANWTAKNTGLGQNAAASYWHVHRTSDGTLYTSDIGSWGSGQRIYKSVDNGDTWTNISPTMGRFFPAGLAPYWFASDPYDPTFVIGGTTDVMLATTDAGTTWTDFNSDTQTNGRRAGRGFSGLLGTRVTFSPYRKGLVFTTAFDAGNLMRTDDGGKTWLRPASSWDNYVGGYDVAVGGLTGRVVVAVLGQTNIFNGIVVSTDAGLTFSGKAGAGVGLPSKGNTGTRAYGSVAFGSRDGSVIYAVLPNGTLYKSTDTGANWVSQSVGASAYCVAVSPDYQTVYVGTVSGVYSGNGTSGYSLLAANPRATQLVFDSQGVLYACTHKAGGTFGLYRYELGKWTRMNTNQYVRDIAIDPTNPHRMMYVTQDDPFNDTTNATGVFVSVDRGATWEAVNTGLPMLRVRSVAFDPWTPGRVVVGTDGRGFWTTNLNEVSS